MLPQGRSCVAIPEHAPALELWDHEPYYVLIGAGYVRGGNDEPVTGSRVEPFLHLVGNLFRGADKPRSL